MQISNDSAGIDYTDVEETDNNTHTNRLSTTSNALYAHSAHRASISSVDPSGPNSSLSPSNNRRRLSTAGEFGFFDMDYDTSNNPSAESGAGAVAQDFDRELMVFGRCMLRTDYFNNMKKCWEPLLETLVTTILYEKVKIKILFVLDVHFFLLQCKFCSFLLNIYLCTPYLR